jgi:ribosomal protein S18 acetylase RimI-like enzyme
MKTQIKTVFISWKNDFINSNTKCYLYLRFMSFQISKADLSDVPALNRLVNSAYRGEESKKGWSTEADLLDGTRIDEAALRDIMLRGDTTILKYEEDANLVGCVELRKEGHKIYLGMLSVKPDIQGGGIGKKLMQASEVFAREQQCKSVFMTVISARQLLIDWYVRHGYHLTGERKPFIMPDSRWGIPKQKLEFVVLEKTL